MLAELYYNFFKDFLYTLFFSFGKRTHAGVPGERRCPHPFDGPGRVLAHASRPSDGRIHFDNEEYYTETGTSSGWFWWRKDSRSLLYVNLIKLFNKNLTSEQHSANCSCITSLILLRVSCD